MPKAKQKPSRNAQRNALTTTVTPAPRTPTGQWLPGFSGRQGIDPARARRALNADTIREMHAAFNRGGRKAIDKVMVNNPAVFLKLLVLLVPRELEVTHSGGVKGMSDEQLERGIEALEAILSRRAAKPGDDAKLVEGVVADGPSADTP